MINKEYKANQLYNAYIDLKNAKNSLASIGHDETIKPLLNEIIPLMNKLQQAYEKAYDEADQL